MADSLRKLIDEAKELIEKEKTITKLLYQLAFIYTNNSPRAAEALELMQRMVEKGLITPRQLKKAIEDVKRWRKMRYRFSKDIVFETDDVRRSREYDDGLGV